jgi:nucleotide-binding universal stress UspA family protein
MHVQLNPESEREVTPTSLSEEKNINPIVMGSHGRTGMSHAWLGSVAERVVRLAPCPVLVVGKKAAAKEGRGQEGA